MLVSKREAALWAAAAAVGFLWWKYGGNPVTAAATAARIATGWVLNVFDRGNKISESTSTNGVVNEVPEVLIDMATAVLGVDAADLETYSLARMGRSEGVDGMEYRMHVVCNMLADLQARYGSNIYSSITALCTHSKVARANGHYSAQNLGKAFATSHDPYEGDYALAQKVLADRANGIDPTGGAVKFVDKSGPFTIDDEPATYERLVASWAKEGLSPSDTLPGATDNFVVFTRAA